MIFDQAGRVNTDAVVYSTSLVAVAVFVNPRSRANRKDPSCVERFARILEGHGRVVAPENLDRLAEESQRVASEQPSVIAIHGGDGTLHQTLSALIAAYGPRALPPIAILPGGTMNVVATSLGIRVKPESLLSELVAGERAGRTPVTLHRRCLHVGSSYGFVFGAGLLSNFLEEYYARGKYGMGRAVWVVLRAVFSLLLAGRYARRIFRRLRGSVIVDGVALPQSDLTGLGAGTVSEIGFRFKLNHRADDDLEQMGAVAIHGSPLSILLDMPKVRLGRGISPKRGSSFTARRIEIQSAEPPTTYTLDGDMYACQGILTVEMGPMLEFVRPGAR